MSKLLLSMIVTGVAALAQAPQMPPANPPAAARPNGLYAHFKTSMGDVTAVLFEKDTPLTVRNFVGLAKGTKPWKDPKTGAMVKRPLYNNTIFHRIMLDGMIQGGDPTGTGAHDCGIKIRDEFLPSLKFDRPGRLAMANTGSPNSGGCQWFITVASPIRDWDGGYTIFGQVVEGQDVVKAISRVPGKRLAEGGLRPITDVKLISVNIERIGPEPAPQPAKTAPAAKK
ncbi:MAG: peptidylprolyl isomerase [Bryobacteraceae bacterium]|jgi:cyclophilin family peptidyl-prolyl cis-trans isomerase